MHSKNVNYFIKRTIILLTIGFTLNSCNNNSTKIPFQLDKSKPDKSDTILILNLEFKETKLLKPIMDKVKNFYHLPVVLKNSKLPEYSYYKARKRYRADSILNFLERYNRKHFRFVAGLTSEDISHTKENINDYGIIGLGSLNNKGCVSSSSRLKRAVNEAKLLERLQKVILHEIGHNHGLKHCNSTYPCFMKDVLGKVSIIDQWPMDICKDCRRKIGLKP